jgi:hypothetical protein
MNNNDTKTKFTATLVTADTKNAVVALREQSGLSEKELMTLIVNAAIEQKDAILAKAQTIVEQQKKDAETRRVEAYQALKARMKAAREQAAAAAKEAKEKAAAKSPKAKAAKTSKAEPVTA